MLVFELSVARQGAASTNNPTRGLSTGPAPSRRAAPESPSITPTIGYRGPSYLIGNPVQLTGPHLSPTEHVRFPCVTQPAGATTESSSANL